MTAIYSDQEKLEEAKRTLQERIDLYPQHIERGMIGDITARRRIDIMRQIVIDLETIAAQLKMPL